METEVYLEENSQLDFTTQNLSQLNVNLLDEKEKNHTLQHIGNINLIDVKSLNLKGNKETIQNLSNNYNNLNLLKLEELNISSCEIQDIPEDVYKLKYLTKLDISNNSLQKVDEEISSLTNLLHLDLSSNKLTNLPTSLKHLTRLRYLNISKNSFNEVPTVLYQGLRLLRKLDMSYNLIELFESLPLCVTTLAELNLNSNELVQVPSWIFSNESCLEIVDLSNNPIYESATITLAQVCSKGSFETLKILNIQNCNLTFEKLDFIFFLKNLRTLLLGNSENSGNQNIIEEIQPRILQNSLLKDLSIPFGGLSVLPANFGILKSIKVLDLSNNFLSWLPDSFCELCNLEVCNLSSNTISFLPEKIGNLTNLKNLFLSNNQLYDLPESFNQLKNLELLDLYNNKIEEFGCDIFNKINLKGVDLEQNLINFEEIIKNCEDLESRYENLKENIRKIMDVVDRRLNLQKKCNSDEYTEQDEDGDFTPREYSEDEHDEHNDLAYEGNIDEAEDWDVGHHEASIGSSVVEVDPFDPNETTDVAFQLAFKKHKEKEIFKGNYCPADNHAPSLHCILLKSIKAPDVDDSIIEGQFDSD